MGNGHWAMGTMADLGFHVGRRRMASRFMSVVIGIGLIHLSSAPVTAAQGGKTEVFPLQKAAPTVMTVETPGSEEELRQQLRSKSQVVALPAATSRLLFSQAPTGSYAFIAPQDLGMALVARVPDLQLERVAPAGNAFEVHKLADGNGMLVGFVAPELLPQLTPSHRPKNIRIMLHSNPSAKAPHIVAVPVTKLVSDRMPVRLDKKKPDSAVVLEMDLQSTTNRALSQGAP